MKNSEMFEDLKKFYEKKDVELGVNLDGVCRLRFLDGEESYYSSIESLYFYTFVTDELLDVMHFSCEPIFED